MYNTNFVTSDELWMGPYYAHRICKLSCINPMISKFFFKILWAVCFNATNWGSKRINSAVTFGFWSLGLKNNRLQDSSRRIIFPEFLQNNRRWFTIWREFNPYSMPIHCRLALMTDQFLRNIITRWTRIYLKARSIKLDSSLSIR